MTCASCGFDAAAWSPEDLRRTVDALAPWFQQLSEGASPEVLVALQPIGRELAGLPRASGSVHRGWQLLSAAGRIRHAATPSQRGVVAQVSTSPGGVPKLSVPSAAVTRRGLLADKQANRIHHGRPWQAVCLWSAEIIDELAAAGHPIAYGSAGENLTLRGLDWSQLRPGVRLLVGTSLLETTPYAIPCTKNAQWFSDGRFRRMGHAVSPGTSRIYARVLVEGTVAAGDAVIVEPAGAAVELTAAQSLDACGPVTVTAGVPAQRPASHEPASHEPGPISA